MDYATVEEYAKDVVKQARDGWVNGTATVAGKSIGVKAHGKWIQRITVNGVPYGSGEFRTQKEMREFIVNFIGE